MTNNLGYNIGTVLTFIGLTLSVTELQAMFSLIATIIGIILIIIDGCLKIHDRIKKAKADGKITEEEKDEIFDTVHEVVDDVKEELHKHDNVK